MNRLTKNKKKYFRKTLKIKPLAIVFLYIIHENVLFGWTRDSTHSYMFFTCPPDSGIILAGEATNLVDLVWSDRPPRGGAPPYVLEPQYTGERGVSSSSVHGWVSGGESVHGWAKG